MPSPLPQRRASTDSGKIPYLYVAGASYTGSTLLAFLLNSHPEMVSVSEVCGVLPENTQAPDAIDTYWCSCGSLLLECPFYLELASRIQAKGSEFDLRLWRTHFQFSPSRVVQTLLTRPLSSPALQRLRDRGAALYPGFNASVREIARRNEHFARATLEISNKRVFVDAQKDAMRIRFLSGMESLDLRVIHLVRDVRGGAASFMKRNPAKDAEAAARRWLNANLAAERARPYVAPDRWLRIRYEEFCSDYQDTVDRIADFVGVARAAISEDYQDTEHHIVGNKMRRGNRRPITVDESWKTRLTDEDLTAIARVGGAANRRFGFDWPGDEASATSAAPTRS